MELKWMVVGALAVIPCAAMAQSKTAPDSSTTRRDSSQQTNTAKTTTTTSTGEVSSSGNIDKNVTQAMLAAQNDPNLIGSPAWWKNHGTADGKPPVTNRTSGPTH
jgi:hypothetical protein